MFSGQDELAPNITSTPNMMCNKAVDHSFYECFHNSKKLTTISLTVSQVEANSEAFVRFHTNGYTYNVDLGSVYLYNFIKKLGFFYQIMVIYLFDKI